MTVKAARAILRKDLAIELRTRQSVPAMALFSVTVFVLFHFGLDRNEIEGSLASGVLWVTLLLATVLAVFGGAVYVTMRHELLARTDVALGAELDEIAEDIQAAKDW